ncbi:MAG: prolyl oligopeptidase family serine peptidase [Candidatus Baltobacteraceae bacterium]
MNARLVSSSGALALVFALIAHGAAQAARPVAPEDLYKLNFISNPQIAPDGSRVAFVVARANGPKDRYDTNLYIVDRSGGALKRIANTGRDSSPAWSPDSRTIAFVRGPAKKGAHAQIFAYNVATGAVRQLSHVKSGASGPVWSHDGKHIAFGSVTLDRVPNAYADFQAAGFKPAKDQRKTDVRIIHNILFENNGEGYTYDRHAHLWVMNADGSGARALTSGTQWSEGNPQWSPDDRTIAFDSERFVSPSSGPNDVYTISAAGGAMHRLRSRYPGNYLLGFDRSGHIWQFRGGVANPGEFAALVRSNVDGSGARDVVATNAVQFGDSVLADMGEPGGMCGPQFAPGDRFALTDEEQPGYSALVKLDPQTGALTKLTESGEAAECTMDRAGRYAAYTRSDFTHPREVYVLDLDTGKSARITGMNDAYLAGVQLSTPQEFSVTDDAGFHVQAWFMPAIGGHGGKHPTLLDIHGGPQTQFGQTFFHELQYWAGRGYNVVFADPRGSTGHGQAFQAALNGKWGEAMFDDVQRVMDAAVQRPSVDAQHLAVSGGSYGGYATLWVISHTHRYKAAIAERAVANLTSEELAADFASNNGFGGFTTYGFGNPWDPKSNNAAESPLTYVENVTTPVMILHSEEDIRTPVDQSLQEFNALRILGKPAEYVVFPGENHDLSRTGSPLHRVERLRVEASWLERTLRR